MGAALVPIAASAAGAGVSALFNRKGGSKGGGGLQSGTAPEVAGATSAIGGGIENLFGGGIPGAISGVNDAMGRSSMAAFMNSLGIDPSILSMGLTQGLANPTDATGGLFSAMQPFEDRQMSQAVAGARDLFGSMGGRFSSNIADAQTQIQGELGQQFALARYKSLLEANAQRNALMRSLIQGNSAQQGNSTALIQSLLGFAQPGEPVAQGSMWPGLLSAGATLGAAYIMRPKGGNA